MSRRFAPFFLMLTAAFSAPLFSQDFGFGAEESSGAFESMMPAATVGGEVSAMFLGYFDDFSNGASHVRLGDVFSGKLNFTAGNSFADAVINLKLSTNYLKLSTDRDKDLFPLNFEEAYLRAYFGLFEIEGGLRKLTWGKADSLGPLDVVNPLDNREITDISDILNIKIARPLVHATARIGHFSKLEGVFLPNFEPARLSSSGRWAPAQLAALPVQPQFPDTSTLDYAQAGLRFTTTIGGAVDVGAQYYYGRLTKPAFKINIAPDTAPSINAMYNPYHQIGVDYAQVLAGFNLRAECAVNITEDTGGDDGAVYNPHFLWSLGFDRDLVWGVNLNLQCNETVRLLYDKIGENPMLDMEADADLTFTQITAILSKKFLRDELELRLAAIWDVEDSDFFFAPSLIWTQDAVKTELSSGVFGGEEDGQFGQYHKNNFIKIKLTYSF